MFCDFILLNYVQERKIVSGWHLYHTNLGEQVKQKKFEVIDKQQVKLSSRSQISPAQQVSWSTGYNLNNVLYLGK